MTVGHDDPGRAAISNLQWLLPGLALSAVVALAICGRVGKFLATSSVVAWLLIFSLGMIFGATLTPIRDALESGTTGVGTCDLSRFGSAPLADLATFNDTSLNVLLFVPLGAAIGLLPDRRQKAFLAASAALLPFAIESIQLVATALHRGCQSADVVDNVTGLVIGLIVGVAIRGLILLGRRRS